MSRGWRLAGSMSTCEHALHAQPCLNEQVQVASNVTTYTKNAIDRTMSRERENSDANFLVMTFSYN